MTFAAPDFNDAVLERLNGLSLTRSFTPQVDIDWNAATTDAEYEALYSSSSLLEGTGIDTGLDRSGRTRFVQYQQMNLMTFTGLLERHGISALAGLFDLESSDSFAEYLGHFIKEELYHAVMFTRAVQKIQAVIPAGKPLPIRSLDQTLRWLFFCVQLIPSRKIRSNLVFTFFRFAEQVTIYVNQLVQSRISRRDSLIRQVWAFHALEESRHLAFDAMMLKRHRIPWVLAWIPVALAAPCCLLLAFLVNVNEVWIAQEVGIPVHLWHLPGLVRRTKAPFKRRVFALLGNTILRRETDPPERE